MNSKALELMKKIVADPNLAKQLRNCNTPDEAYKIATACVSDYKKEDFIADMRNINKVISEINNERITKADLASLDKGSSTSTIVSAVSTYTGAAAAGAAAAAV